MNVTCANCKKTYALPDAAFTAGVQVRVRCKNCQNIFTVEPPAAPPAAAGAAPAQVLSSEPAPAEADPFAKLSEVPASAVSDPNKPPGEVTRYFIAQSGAGKRNPPWKIALFVVAGIGVPVGLLYLLSSFSVVKLEVTRTNADGEEVKEEFFSGNGISGLKDLMTGEEARRKEAAAKAKAERAAKAAAAAAAAAKEKGLGQLGGPVGGPLDSSGRMGGSAGAVAAGDPDFVGSADPRNIGALRKDAAPKLRGVETNAPAPSSAGGLPDDAAAKVVAQSQPAFQGCIEQSLRRNPNLKVGKVAVVVQVVKSGVVKSASIEPKKHLATDWGECLVNRARKMVFPPFSGDDEAEVQVPLVVGFSP